MSQVKKPLSQLPGFVPDLEGDEYDPIWFAKLFNGNASAFKRRIYEIARNCLLEEDAQEQAHSTGTLPSSQGEFLSCEETVIPETHLSDSQPA